MYEKKIDDKEQELKNDENRSLFKKNELQGFANGIRLPHGFLKHFPLTSSFRLLCLFKMISSCLGEVTNPYYFVQNGTNYKIATSINIINWNKYSRLSWQFFQKVGSNIQEGKYGGVTDSHAMGNLDTTIWSRKVCDYVMHLTRNSSATPQPLFENLFDNDVTPTADNYQGLCDDMYNDGVKALGITFGAIIGTILLLGLICSLACYCSAKRRDKYQSIPSPEENKPKEGTKQKFITDVRIKDETPESHQNTIPLKLSRYS